MSEPRAKPIALALIAVVGMTLAIHAMHKCGEMRSRPSPSITLDAKHARFTIFRDGRLRIETHDRARTLDAEMVRSDDDGVRALTLADLTTDGTTRVRAALATFTVDAAHDALDVSFEPNDAGAGDDVAVGVRMPTGGREVFLSGRGDLGDLANDSGPFAILEDATHPVGFVADGEPLSVAIEPSTPHELALRVMHGKGKRFTIAIGSAAGVWPVLFERAKVETARVKGRVTGATGTAHVVGLDDASMPQIRVATDAAGRFDFGAPRKVQSFYASASATRTSAPVIYPAGTPWELKLDVSDGGELHVRALDGETHAPITARLVVHGIEGTLDPSFGPDYRASGAGPIIDALRGEITTPLPAGKYRVAATKGIEWSIDTRIVEIEPGKRASIDLEPRHVVPTPGELGCDLHVHARPSFDAPVTVEDRVLSLVAAGIDFAVPSEHNLVGNYGPSIKLLGVESEISFVPGVEVTTYMPKFGHFGAFPYATDKAPPPFKNTDVNRVFLSVHADPKRALIVNHPRLTREIGFFSASGWKPGGPIPVGMRTDFDGVEVFNGYESAALDRVEIVLQDYFALLNAGHRYAATGSSDSHRIQYQWAGYPRTMVRVGVTDDDEKRADPLAVVAALKAGRATVTSGPILELELEGAKPGGEVPFRDHALRGHLLVRAAPWVDVTSANIIVGGRIYQTFDVPPRAMLTGPEVGSPEEVAARTVRLDAEILIEISALKPTNPSNANPASSDVMWVMATARGTRMLDDILPFMPLQPFAATNPIFVLPK